MKWRMSTRFMECSTICKEHLGATTKTQKIICRTLGMDNLVYVVDIPDRPNIKYTVIRQPICFEEAFSSLVEAVRKERVQMGRVIIYCRSYDDCSSVYLYFRSKLRSEITVYPSLSDSVKLLWTE